MMQLTTIAAILTGVFGAFTLISEDIFIPVTLAMMILAFIFLFLGVIYSAREAMQSLKAIEEELKGTMDAAMDLNFKHTMERNRSRLSGLTNEGQASNPLLGGSDTVLVHATPSMRSS
jgi:hypothetical protein